MAEMIKNLLAMQETQFRSLGQEGQEDPLEKGMQPTAVFLPGKFHGRGARQATIHGVGKRLVHDLVTKQ